MSLNFEGLKPLVEAVARKAHASFPDYYDIQDTQQDIWVWAVENEQTVRNILADTHTSEIKNNKALFDLMLRAARESLKAEDAASNQYDKEDLFYYSQELIESILEVVYQHEYWQSFATALDKMPSGKSDPATAGNNLASYVDVSRAVSQLRQEQEHVIIWRHKYKYTFESIGAELGCSRQAAQSRYNVALRDLQRTLGGRDFADLQKPSPGRTEPSTLAEAQAMIEHDYNG